MLSINDNWDNVIQVSKNFPPPIFLDVLYDYSHTKHRKTRGWHLKTNGFSSKAPSRVIIPFITTSNPAIKRTSVFLTYLDS